MEGGTSAVLPVNFLNYFEFVNGQPSKPFASAHQPSVTVKMVPLYLENWPALTDAVFGALACFVGWFDSDCLFFVFHYYNIPHKSSEVKRQCGTQEQ